MNQQAIMIDIHSDSIPVTTLFTVLIIFLFFADLFLNRRKKSHEISCDGDLKGFHEAVLSEDIESMKFQGDRVIWNEFKFYISRKRIVFNPH